MEEFCVIGVERSLNRSLIVQASAAFANELDMLLAISIHVTPDGKSDPEPSGNVILTFFSNCLATFFTAKAP